MATQNFFIFIPIPQVSWSNLCSEHILRRGWLVQPPTREIHENHAMMHRWFRLLQVADQAVPPPLAAGNRPVHISTLLPDPWRPCKETAGNVTTLLVGGPNTSRCRPWVTCLSDWGTKKHPQKFSLANFFLEGLDVKGSTTWKLSSLEL